MADIRVNRLVGHLQPRPVAAALPVQRIGILGGGVMGGGIAQVSGSPSPVRKIDSPSHNIHCVTR